MTIVAGVGVLFGWNMVGKDGLPTVVKNRQTNLVACPCLGLDLFVPGPLEPNGLGPVDWKAA